MNYLQPPYSTRYPKLLELQGYLAKPGGVPPEGNVVRYNICMGGNWTEIGWFATPAMIDMHDNLIDLNLFANLRPAILYPELANASTLKPEVVAGLDILIDPPPLREKKHFANYTYNPQNALLLLSSITEMLISVNPKCRLHCCAVLPFLCFAVL